jgi:hypothetical protein
MRAQKLRKNRRKIALQWYNDKLDEQAKRKFQGFPVSKIDLKARGLLLEAGTIERFERLCALAEARAFSALRTLERRRASNANVVRRDAEEAVIVR